MMARREPAQMPQSSAESASDHYHRARGHQGWSNEWNPTASILPTPQAGAHSAGISGRREFDQGPDRRRTRGIDAGSQTPKAAEALAHAAGGPSEPHRSDARRPSAASHAWETCTTPLAGVPSSQQRSQQRSETSEPAKPLADAGSQTPRRSALHVSIPAASPSPVMVDTAVGSSTPPHALTPPSRPVATPRSSARFVHAAVPASWCRRRPKRVLGPLSTPRSQAWWQLLSPVQQCRRRETLVCKRTSHHLCDQRRTGCDCRQQQRQRLLA
jgi:hypothetical protein